MNIQELNEKNLARAKSLANELGVEVQFPDLFQVAEKAKRKIEHLAKYNANKEMYDNAIHQLLELVPGEKLLELIQNLQSTNTK